MFCSVAVFSKPSGDWQKPIHWLATNTTVKSEPRCSAKWALSQRPSTLPMDAANTAPGLIRFSVLYWLMTLDAQFLI